MCLSDHAAAILQALDVPPINTADAIILFVRGSTNFLGGAHSTLSVHNQMEAEAYGRALQGRLARVICSPSQTSLQTAVHIAHGAGVTEPERLSLLDDPGPFVADQGAAWSAIKDFPIDQQRSIILEGILRGRAHWAHSDPRHAAESVMMAVIESMELNRIVVCVAPGTVISATLAFALGVDLTFKASEGPAGLFEGAIIWRDQHKRIGLRMGRYQGYSTF